MLLRLYLLRRHAAATSPTHNHAASLCDDLIRRGRKPWQRFEGNQRGRQLVNLRSLQPSAVSRQPSASSLQPRPSPERREATAKPSEPFSRLLTRPAILKRLQPRSLRPMADPVREAASKPASRHTKSY